MAIEFRNLVPMFLEFWDDAESRPLQEQLDLWHAYVERYPEVLDDVTRTGGDVPDAASVLTKYPELIDRIRANAGLVEAWVAEAASLVPVLLDATDLELSCVGMVGLVRSNAWVSQRGSRPTQFVAVEQIANQDLARVLVAHEMAHACQFGVDAAPWLDDERIGLLLFAEGFATQLTVEAFPEFGVDEHLWFGPGFQQWLADCEPLLADVARSLRPNLTSNDSGLGRRYFTLRQRSDDLPDRIGYLVGVRVLERLRADYAWPELARWTPDRALVEVDRVLATLA